MSQTSIIDFVAQRLSQRAPLSDDDMAAICALPVHKRHARAHAYLVREGEPLRAHCSIIISGLAFRHKLTAEGARQIVSLSMKGDFLDVENLFLNISDHSIQALTELELAEVDRQALQQIVLERPAVGRALWLEGLVNSSIYREWVLNVGRRDARARIAHILCELAVRMQVAGDAGLDRFQLPMTQEQIGDATGLTSVHVNRTLKALATEKLIDHSGRWISILDWNGIRRVGDFNPLYLHLDQVAPQFDKPMNVLFDRHPPA